MPPQREGEPDDRNDPDPAPRQPLGQPVDQLSQRPGALDHREGAPYQKHVEDHGRRVGHALRDGDHGVERVDRAGRDRVVGSGHDDLASGHRILPAVVLAGRQQPGAHRRHQDAQDEQDQRVGKAEPRSAHRARHRRVTGGTFPQAMRSFIEPVIGPQAAVWASRTASSSDPADAVPVPDCPWNSTATEHSARWAERVDQRRKATNASDHEQRQVAGAGGHAARNLRAECGVHQGVRTAGSGRCPEGGMT